MPALVVGINEAGSRPERVEARFPRSCRAFTLIDVLVTMAVVGVLIAIMLPSLAAVRETAHQVICRSNVRQIGYGIEMHAEANKNTIPYTVSVPLLDVGPDRSFDTMTLRFGPEWPGVQVGQWDGLGWLYEEQLLPVAKIFYCPSHKGAHHYREYSEQWRDDESTIVGNFQYRGRGPTGGQPRMTVRLDHIQPGAAIVADGLRTQSDFNHVVGANVLRADLSVDWFSDSGRTVVEQLPKDGQTPSAAVLQNVWSQLDLGSVR